METSHFTKDFFAMKYVRDNARRSVVFPRIHDFYELRQACVDVTKANQIKTAKSPTQFHLPLIWISPMFDILAPSITSITTWTGR